MKSSSVPSIEVGETPRRGRPRNRVSGPLPFTPEEQAVILEFLFYADCESVAAIQSAVRVAETRKVPHGASETIKYHKQIRGWIKRQCSLVGQKRKQRRLVDGVLVRGYEAEE